MAVFAASIKRSKAFLLISEALPFIAFQLGDTLNVNTSATLEGGVDTMCGASIGNLDYHRLVYERNPEMVVQFEALADLSDQQGFGIGGIDGNADGAKVTHIITYRTPYMVNGAQLFISLGLGNFGIKTLFSYPLLKALKATILLESGTLISYEPFALK